MKKLPGDYVFLARGQVCCRRSERIETLAVSFEEHVPAVNHLGVKWFETPEASRHPERLRLSDDPVASTLYRCEHAHGTLPVVRNICRI